MTNAIVAPSPGAQNAAPAAPAVRFTAASRPMVRQSKVDAVSTLAGATSFSPIMLPATGWVRKISLYFTYSLTCASAGAVVAGDGPWNLVSGVSLTDATGQPIVQPISGYSLYLLNKWLPGISDYGWRNNPHMGPEYAFSATATTGTAVFRLDLELEQDYKTGYGCIPNLDSNASLQLKIDLAPFTVAFSATGATQSLMSLIVEQHYWAPIGDSVAGVSVVNHPAGPGDYLETRVERPVTVPLAENTVALTARGGFTKGLILVSRAAGVRTDFVAGSNVGLVYDNNAILEGMRLESFKDQMRRDSGYLGADLTTSYAPLTPGVLPGLDRGVLVYNFDARSENRDTWLSTRAGTLLQAKVTPGTGANDLEVMTCLGQVGNAEAFFRD